MPAGLFVDLVVLLDLSHLDDEVVGVGRRQLLLLGLFKHQFEHVLAGLSPQIMLLRVGPIGGRRE